MRKIPSMDTLLPKLPLSDAPNVDASCMDDILGPEPSIIYSFSLIVLNPGQLWE